MYTQHSSSLLNLSEKSIDQTNLFQNVSFENEREFSIESDSEEVSFSDSIARIGSKEVPSTQREGGALNKGILEKLKKYFGFWTKDCLNGGTENNGKCSCPQYFKGDLCEEIICLNNGTAQTTANTGEPMCKCPNPDYIYGVHCENIRCVNGGKQVNDSYCRCMHNWYAGQFCQNYTASWGMVIGVPLICVIAIIICCIVCRLDLCPRKSVRRRRRRRLPQSGQCTRRAHSSRNPRLVRNTIPNRHQENLISEGNQEYILRREGINPSYVIRLDTIPAFNPSNYMDSDFKPIDPPPSYEQIMASENQTANNETANSAGGNTEILPPAYSPYAGTSPEQSNESHTRPRPSI